MEHIDRELLPVVLTIVQKSVNMVLAQAEPQRKVNLGTGDDFKTGALVIPKHKVSSLTRLANKRSVKTLSQKELEFIESLVSPITDKYKELF